MANLAMDEPVNDADLHFRGVVDRLDVGIARLDDALRHRYANASMGRLIGHEPGTLLGHSAAELSCDIRWCEALDDAAARLRSGGQEQVAQVELASARGPLHLMLRLTPDQDDGGARDGFVVEALDVSLHRQAEDRASRHDALLRAFMDHGDLLAWLADEQGRIAYGNRHWLASLGLEESQVLGRSAFELFAETEARQLRDQELEALSGHGPRVSLDGWTSADGNTRWFQTTRFPFHDIDGRRYVGSVAIDATERVRRDQQLQMLAVIDPVAGVLNARGFQLLAGTELRRARRRRSSCTLLLADLGALQDLQARLGRESVTQIVQVCALLLRGAFRETDLVARIDESRFAVLASDSAGEVELLKQRLRRAILELDSNPVLKAQIELSVSLLHCPPDEDTDLETLLQRAGDMLQKEKRRGLALLS